MTNKQRTPFQDETDEVKAAFNLMAKKRIDAMAAQLGVKVKPRYYNGRVVGAEINYDQLMSFKVTS